MDVAIFDGPINEYRQAQDAAQAAKQFGKAFTTLAQYSQRTGLDDGSISRGLAQAVCEANAVVSATQPGRNFDTELTGPNGMMTLIFPGLQSSISKEILSWPSPADRRAATDKLSRDAQAMKEAAEALMRASHDATVTSVVAVQARFSDAQSRFYTTEEKARNVFDQCTSVINSLTNIVSGVITPDVLATLHQKNSQFEQLRGDLRTLNANEQKITQAASNATKQLGSLATLASQAQQAAADTEAASRLVNYDASMDLSDPHWRYLADAPQENWRTFQHISTEADGSANYIIIQEGMGDFRLKKLFNDPTEGYKAGVQIGQKVFQTAASAAITAMSGGAGAALLPSQKSTTTATSASTQSGQAPNQTPAANPLVVQNEAILAVLETNRVIVKTQITQIVGDLATHRTAPALSTDYLLSVSNKLDALRVILQTKN